MEHSVILDPASARAFMEQRKTQFRVSAGHVLGSLGPGRRILGREACAPGRLQNGKEILTNLQRAEFVAFADGWRQDRAGHGWQGSKLQDPNEMWISAVHMPAWACRVELELRTLRSEQLHAITAKDLSAEGVSPVLGGLLWRGPKPLPGLFRSARGAFAAHWDVTHPVPGLRWADNPQVLVLDVRLAG